MGTAKIQLPLMHHEDLSMPDVLVLNADMRCSSCREKVFQAVAKIKGLREYIVDVPQKQVIIKADVRSIWSSKELRVS